MFEWWQTVALSLGTLVVGGAIAVSSAYVQRRWAKSDTLEADSRASLRRLEEEEREAARQKEAEEREATRQWRRERVKPLQDFLEVAKQHDATIFFAKSLEEAWERNAAGIKDKMSLEDARKAMAEDARFADPDFFDVARAVLVAHVTAPTLQITEQLRQFLARKTDEDGLAALRSLEQLIEDYVSKV